MANSCKYYKQQRQVSYDNGVTWIDLQEFRKGALYEPNSSDCTNPSIKIYRWQKADSSDYVCVGDDKHYKEYYQESSDNGQTWSNVVPTTTRASSQVIEYDSSDCVKFKATYSGGTTYSAACDSDTTLTTATTKPSGYVFSGMTDAVVGNCVEVIGVGAFYNCDNLSSITLSDSITTISNKAFSQSKKFNNIYLPDSVTTIGEEAFAYCHGLTQIDIPTGVTSISNKLFYYCRNLNTVNIPNTVTSVGHNAFNNCSGLTSIVIPDSVTSLGWAAFEGCISLTSITLSNNLTSIEHSTFYDCSSLRNITIPYSVTSINEGAFMACTSLTSITIPNSVTSIGTQAIYNCSGLTSVTIGSGVTSIGNFAFRYCSGLTSITCLAQTPPTLSYYVFDNTNDCPIYVPAASVETYKSASGWSTYSSRIFAIQ